jgi:hypothetical protein
MIRRLTALSAMIAAGWYLYTRFVRPPANQLGESAGARLDDPNRGVVDRVSGAAAGAASMARRAARRITTRQS